MRMTLLHSAALICAVALASTAMAQDHTSHKTMKHDMTAAPAGDQSASSKAFAAANAKMHTDMAITFTGKPDRDFVLGMIAHHRARSIWQRSNSNTARTRKSANWRKRIIAAQESEIRQMKDWLQKNGG